MLVVSAMAAAVSAELPVITVQPVEVKVTAGFPAVFSVVAAGGGTLRYQWRKNGVALAGATSATYRIDATVQSDENYGGTAGYDVVVTGDGGSVTSTRAWLTVVEGGAYIIENPSGGSVKTGLPYTLRVTAGESGVTYQWRRNGVAIAGATGASYLLSAVGTVNAGRYDVVVRNSFGEVYSTPAYVGVATKVAPNLQKATYDWTTLAGSGLPGSVNGTGLAAQFNNPSSIAMDGLGNIYVADTNNHAIRKVTQTGVVTTVAGSLGAQGQGSVDGSALSTARLDSPQGIAVDKAGAVYIAEPNTNTVRKLTSPGLSSASVSTVAGVAGQFGVTGGLNTPWKVALDPSGGLYVLDDSSIRKVVSKTQFTLLFGELPEAYTGTQPVPMAMALDSSGKIFAAAYEGAEFKVFSRLTTGTFTATNYGPYPFPITDLALGAGSNLYAATESTVQLLGDVSLSTPASGLPVNLTAAVDYFAAPRALTVDAEGTVYAVDPFLNTVIKGTPSGLPVFLSHPVGGTAPLTLTATTVGPGTLSYQWYRDGVAISGATGASYTMASGAAGGGVYTVEASNTSGTVTSGTATVGTSTQLAILSAPRAATVVVGTAVALEVVWQGPSNTTFQWYRNNVLLSGGTSAILRFSSAKLTDTGDYRVELRAASELQNSVPVRLTVEPQLAILREPQSATVLAGTSAALEVGWEGPGSTTLQWYRNGVALSGGTSAILRFPSAKVADTDVYQVELLAGVTLRTSAPVRFTVEPQLAIRKGPQAATLVAGTSAALEVDWDGPSTTTVQWYRNNVALSGGTLAVYRLSPVRATDAGLYRVELKAGSVLQAGTASITVNTPVSIFNQPEKEVAVAVGKPFNLTVSATGTAQLTYQWYKNEVPINGGTAATYRVQATTNSDAGTYKVEVRNVVGPVFSDSSVVSILTPPEIKSEPTVRSEVKIGDTLTFSVDAGGSQPLVYQWRKDGVPSSGGTAATLELRNVQEKDAGFYDVLVSNALGSVTSRAAQLVVNLPPRILTQPPASISVTVDAKVSLGVAVSGTGPFSYKWYLMEGGGSTLVGTGSTYSVPTSRTGSAQYFVEVRNPFYPTAEQSRVTTLTISPGRGISVLGNPDPVKATNVIRGTATSVRVSVDLNPPDALRTTYKLVRASGVETGISGIVPANGQIDVPLRSLTADGFYRVVLSREYADGEVIGGVVTADFEVRLKTLEDAAGTYELLLADEEGLVGDGAAYRGMLVATVSKTGAVSGRVLYNEAAPLETAPETDLAPIGTERAYVAVVRSFSSSFTPSAENPARLVCTPKLGVGTQANRQALTLELDFSTATFELSAFVRDWVSVPPYLGEAGCKSEGNGAVRGLTKLTGVPVESGTVDFGSLEGRYAIGSDFTIESGSGPGLDNNATLLAQVLKTGKVLWTSRLSGSTGSGSATLSTTSADAARVQIYQGRTSSTSKFLSTTSLLGQLRFQLVSVGTVWSAGVATAHGDDRLERQSCYVSKISGKPVFDNGFDFAGLETAGFRWSGAQAVDFQNGTSCRWPSPTALGLKTFFNSGSGIPVAEIPPLYLTAEDPVLGDIYVWTVAMSATGTVRVANYTSTVQPTLTFRFDKTRGEWAGSFVSPGTRLRCNLVGVVARPSDEEPLRGAGWVDTGVLPATRTGGWRLELLPPEAQ